MGMFCFQCEEALNNTGCNVAGVCGKPASTSNLQDLLLYTAKGLAIAAKKTDKSDEAIDFYIIDALFTTITNANFSDEVLYEKIKRGILLRDGLKKSCGGKCGCSVHDSVTYTYETDTDLDKKAKEVGILATKNEDIRSLREMLILGIKGIAAYAKHAANLNKIDQSVFNFIKKALIATTDDSLTVDELIGLNLEAGKVAVDVMALLDSANTGAFGSPEISEVNIGVSDKPGILISGHDLNDIVQLLEQTKGTGVDVYTHCEMLPAHYYPELKKYDNLVGNYGGAWWTQKDDFEKFNGPILMTTNCIVPPKKSYKDRFFTTGSTAVTGCTHIDADSNDKKDFSAIIELAKKCEAPTELETGKIIGGFAHNQVLALADKVIDAVKSGAIKKFFVMAGCDGRKKERQYYTDFAKALPKDTVILTAGCAKYRYNKLDLGDIGGIPRVLDAGQCNDSYSLAVIALKLQEVFQLNDINDLPIEFNIAWYEQKAVTVLLALLHLGVKNIHLGPSLPSFLSPNVAKVLIENFGISGISNVEDDMNKFLG